MKVSVLLLTYNHENYVAQAIESVLMQQTNFAFELVIIEDCSTDKTREIVIHYRDRFPGRIQLKQSTTNTASYRNVGNAFQASNAQYIAMLDGDDYWISPKKLQKQVDFLDKNADYAMCFHGVKTYWEDRNKRTVIDNPRNETMTWQFEDILDNNFIPGCSAMIRKESIPQIPEWYATCIFGDWELYLLSAQRGKIGSLGEILGMYRRHMGGVWSGLNTITKFELVIDFYKKMNVHFHFKHDRAMRHMISRSLSGLALEYCRQGNLNLAAVMMKESIAERMHLMDQDMDTSAEREIMLDQFTNQQLAICRSFNRVRLLKCFDPLRRTIHRVASLTLQWWRRFNGKANGRITAVPNPIPVASELDGGGVTLAWDCGQRDKIEVRMGAPDGPILRAGVGAGILTTEKWIFDRMVFYLMDVSDGASLKGQNVMDSVAVYVTSHPFKRVLKRVIGRQ